MFDSITLGQYYQTDSLLHRLDPRVKLVGTFTYLISLFVVDSYIGYVLAALFLAVMIMLSNVPFRYIIRGMKAILFLLLLTVVFNTRRGDMAVQCLQDHKGGPLLRDQDGSPIESVDPGILDHDADDNSYAADRRAGESS